MRPALKAEFPYAHAVTEDCASVVCSYCMKMDLKKTLQHCGRCKFAHYCNSTCQKRDWADHKAECQLLVNSYPTVYNEMTRIFVRIIAKKRKNVKPAFNGRTLESLESHVKEIRNDSARMDLFNFLAATVVSFMGYQNIPSPDEMLEIYGKISTNAFGVESLIRNRLGIALYIGFSELDHSCDPDVYVLFHGATMAIYGLKESVKKYDKKLRISYCDTLEYGPVRRKLLNERFFFTCDCSNCEDTMRDAVARSLRCQYCKGGYCPLFLDGDTVYSKPECVHCGLVTSLDVDDAVALMKKIDAEAERLRLTTGGKPAGLGFTVSPNVLNLRLPEGSICSAIAKARELHTTGESVLSHFNISLCHLARSIGTAIYCSPVASTGIASWAYRAELHEKVLICLKRHFPGRPQPLCIMRYHNIGSAHLSSRNIEKAKVYLEKALRLGIETFGSEDVCTLHTKHLLDVANCF